MDDSSSSSDGLDWIIDGDSDEDRMNEEYLFDDSTEQLMLLIQARKRLASSSLRGPRRFIKRDGKEALKCPSNYYFAKDPMYSKFNMMGRCTNSSTEESEDISTSINLEEVSNRPMGRQATKLKDKEKIDNLEIVVAQEMTIKNDMYVKFQLESLRIKKDALRVNRKVHEANVMGKKLDGMTVEQRAFWKLQQNMILKKYNLPTIDGE